MNLETLSDTDLKQLYKKTLNLVTKFHNFQLAMKIVLNSGYGAMSNRYFQHYSDDLAESITMSGQLAIKWIEKYLNEYFNKLLGTENIDYVLYLDTDSVVGSTIIDIDGNKITIEDFYNSISNGNLIKEDHFNEDYVKLVSDKFALSFNVSSMQPEYGNIKYVMKHKVKKRLFRIKTLDSYVDVTEDHSIIVRDNETGEIKSIKPKDIKAEKHKIINISCADTGSTVNFTSEYTIEDLGIVEEYVYDIEIEENHNFFANDILVHNSAYLKCEAIVEKFCQNMTTEETVQFLDNMAEKALTPFISKSYQSLADLTNAYSQEMVMKRENIADRGIWTGRKKYILNVWDSEGVRYAEPHIKLTGIEAIRSSTPYVCREYIKKSIDIIMKGTEEELQEYIKVCKEDFIKLPFEEIARPSGVNGILEYSDRSTIYKKGTPIHIRAALIYNNEILKNKIEKEYPLINDGDKIKYCYMKTPNPFHENVFAISTRLPVQLHLQSYIDYDEQFHKTFIQPLELILEKIGWSSTRKVSLEGLFSW